ncbi:hypothetical protein LPTSP4_29040 [Leptospira ryugenii]|uniref:Uncharacterized protein n=1 Tax=Leptospira ryugenii TaxID=1917863 RepID=A0A2P2E399_9LEPT|nr:hypothetical protein [Leptospira ryugenii]GBF51368.1 hypothetical protein LPTSP4_29040 [Leptospira ryugenii]
MTEEFDKLAEFSKQLKSGELYESLVHKLEEFHREKKGQKRNKDIDLIQMQIEKKEEQIQKLLGDLIRLQNQLSDALDKELRA